MGELPALELADFAAFVEAVHGWPPFSWQRELAAAFAAGEDVAVYCPPGLGKTLAVDAAVFATALQAGRAPAERAAAHRTVVTVNRRLIVDSTFDHATSLAETLDAAWHTPEKAGPVVAAVAARLARVAGAEPGAGPRRPSRPLRVVRMHGGTSWQRLWAPHPQQPTVVVATPDQAISRMLLRGYGTSRTFAPIDAATVTINARIVVDEAHLTPAVAATVRTVRARHRAANTPAGRSPQLASMTATARPETADELRLIDATGESDEAAAARLTAPRLLHLHRAPRARSLPAVLAAAATELAEAYPEVGVVGVVANTVAHARAIHRLLVAEGRQAMLVIGPTRGVDRQRITERLYAVAGVDREPDTRGPVDYLVATQTIEVGVNLDVDALVTEACPIDALVQRLGRLDRLGRRSQAGLPAPCVAVLHTSTHPKADPGAPVYGPSVRACWAALAGYADELVDTTPVYGGKRPVKPAKAWPVDWQALVAWTSELAAEQLAAIQSPAAPVPALAFSQVDDWARTSPVDRHDTAPAPYIHGLEDQSPEVAVCWRADIDPARLAATAARSVAALSPHPDETITLRVAVVRRWLAGLDPGAVADVLGAEPTEQEQADDEPAQPTEIAWLDPDGTVHTGPPRALVPNVTVLVPATAGGYDEHGWNPDHAGPVRDVADLAHSNGEQTVVRLHPATLEGLLGGPVELDLELVASLDRGELRGLLTELPAGPLIDAVRTGARLQRTTAGEAADGLWVATSRSGRATEGAIRHDDDTASLTTPVQLGTHLAAVGAQAAHIAEASGLPAPAVAAARLAAAAHDVGKADPRFQAMLHGGQAPGSEQLLAKSGMDPSDRAGLSAAARLAGWPQGFRHETISLVLWRDYCARHGEDPQLAGVDLELVGHLIAAHHGYYRPLPPPVPDLRVLEVTTELFGRAVTATPEAIRQAAAGLDHPGLFAALTDRYGPHGLASLEAAVRLADIAASKAGT